MDQSSGQINKREHKRILYCQEVEALEADVQGDLESEDEEL